MITIEEGKFYKDAEGKKCGPLVRDEENVYWHYEESVGAFRNNGKSHFGDDPDLIEEWQDEHAMPSDESLINFNLRNAATMLIEATRYEDAISILYILKGENG